MALLHACTIQDGAFIGMHSTILDGAVVESNAMVAAKSLVPPNKVVKSGELWAGSPARKVRDLSQKELDSFKLSVNHYVQLGKAYRGEATYITCTAPTPLEVIEANFFYTPKK
ncbi:hypothetical protein HDU93_007754 [Gonapodya sp. JEL0774]|nr:hypothetical protein HDU93_007754 [Gonapodya sp. JEL0774]